MWSNWGNCYYHLHASSMYFRLITYSINDRFSLRVSWSVDSALRADHVDTISHMYVASLRDKGKTSSERDASNMIHISATHISLCLSLFIFWHYRYHVINHPRQCRLKPVSLKLYVIYMYIYVYIITVCNIVYTHCMINVCACQSLPLKDFCVLHVFARLVPTGVESTGLERQ